MSSLFYNTKTKEPLKQVFSQILFDSSLIESTKIPRDPILINKTSNSVTLQLPVFNPKISIKLLLEDPSKSCLSKV